MKSRREQLLGFAQENRENMTEAEERLWNYIQGGQLGVTFWRQHVVGEYIVDFHCPEIDLAIEVDGPMHKLQKGQDSGRQAYLEACGMRVLRFSNWQVFNRISWVLDQIRSEIGR